MGCEAQGIAEGKSMPQGTARALYRRRGLYDLRAAEEGGGVAQVTESEPVALDPLLEDPRRTGDEEENLARYQPTSHSGFKDATTGEELPPHLTRAARREELAFMSDWKVWEEVSVQEWWNTTGKPPLGGKWVDVNKGDDQNPLVRSRYVAMEIAKKTGKCVDFFAATPPLETLRLVLSRVASNRSHGRGGRKLLVIDARKAHLKALAGRKELVCATPAGACQTGYLRQTPTMPVRHP